MKGIIAILDDDSQVVLDFESHEENRLPAVDQVRGLLRAVRYILDTPEGGSILSSAVLASRRAREWHVLKAEIETTRHRGEAIDHPIKPEMIGGLMRYKENRIPTGGFLRQVLENNLKEAVRAADTENQWAIPALVSWCYNNLPSIAWGSPEAVSAWLTREEPK